MKRTLLTLALLALSATMIVAQDEAAKLTAVLQDPDASLYAKLLACKQAAQTGTKESVPPLAAVLLDESLSHPARIALQQIPGPEATQALCHALSNAKGNILIGIVGTIGERRDPATVSPLEACLADDNPQIVFATAVALGKIGSAEALAALQNHFHHADTAQKALLVDGLFACAERLSVSGKTTEAITVYRQVQEQRDLPITARQGAMIGLLLALGPAASTTIEQHAVDPDDGAFLAMVKAVRNLKLTELTPTLLAVLPTLEVDRQTLLLDVLDCRGDVSAGPAVLAMAKNNNAPAQLAAVRALAGLPSSAAIEFLLATAAGNNNDLARAAADALARMQSPGLERQIIEQLKKTDVALSVPLVQVCRLRKIGDATPVLLPLLSTAEDSVRLAVIEALGNTVSGENIEVLIEQLSQSNSDAEFQAIQSSLRVVSHRTVDQDVVATKLAAIYPDAPLRTQCALLELFGALGGGVAIAAVQNALANPAEEIQDTASRVLGEWQDPAAAPVLLSIMQSQVNDRFKTRALRGYIRIVRQMDVSNDHRFNMSMQALALAQRNEEKLLLVEALGRIPTPASLAKISEFLDQPTFAELAATSAISVGRAILTQKPAEVAAAMRKILEVTKNAETRHQAEELLQ